MHGHLLEYGFRKRDGKEQPGHNIFGKTLNANLGKIEDAAVRAMQKQLDKIVAAHKSGKMPRRTASLFRKASRLSQFR